LVIFHSDTNKRLREQGWLAAINESGNPSQARSRFTESAIAALSELGLLYRKMPLEERDELFNQNNLKRFFDTLLSTQDLNSVTKLEIVTYLIRLSINVFKEKYTESNKDTNTIASLVNDYLDKAVAICEEITYKEKLNQSKFELQNKKMEYLCEWYKIPTRDKIRFKNFIKINLNFVPQNFIIYHYKDDEIRGSFSDNSDQNFEIILTLNRMVKRAFLRINRVFTSMENNPLYASQNLIIKQTKEEYLLYYEKSTFKVSKNKIL
jgi:hypothetical protein